MTTVETEVLDEFDLDIQLDDTDLPARKYEPRAQTQTLGCSCSGCCPTQWCISIPQFTCSEACN
jgi:hypothetical protein